MIPLFPTYLMPGNPQITISPTAIKKYNEYRSVRQEALEWFKITTSDGRLVCVPTIKKKIEEEALDFIKIDIMAPKTRDATSKYISVAPTIKEMRYCSEILIPTTTNHVFSKNEELDITIVHQRLGHAMEDKINKMAKLEIIKDLPKRKSKRYKGAGCRCLICWKASTVNIPKGVTLTTEKLRPGELIHIDFCS